jgi:hypothetical protein
MLLSLQDRRRKLTGGSFPPTESNGARPEVSMSTFDVTRRDSLGVAVAIGWAGALGGASAGTRPVGGISVDIASLRTNALDPTAAWVAHAMPGVLAQALVEAGRPGAPICIRIDCVAPGPTMLDGRPARARTGLTLCGSKRRIFTHLPSKPLISHKSQTNLSGFFNELRGIQESNAAPSRAVSLMRRDDSNASEFRKGEPEKNLTRATEPTALRSR